MEEILDLPVQTQRALKYAGFWIRVAAYFIDWICLSIFQWIAVFLMTAAGILEADPVVMVVVLYSVLFIGNLVYFCVMESSSTQGTLGKMAVGIRVGNAHGEKISFLNSLGRFFGKIFLAAFTLLISWMWAGWDSKKQALHDKLANTYVFYR